MKFTALASFDAIDNVHSFRNIEYSYLIKILEQEREIHALKVGTATNTIKSICLNCNLKLVCL